MTANATGPIIDLHAHLHAFPLPVERCTADDLLRVMDRLKIETTAVSSTEAILCDMVSGNAALCRDIAGRDRIKGYAFANPNFIARSRDEVRRYLSDESFIGLKMYSGAYIGRPLDCPGHAEILTTVAEEFPWALILFHCGENDPANFAGLASLAKRFPDLTFIAGHMGSKLWRDALPVLSTEPNIVAEICAPVPARNRIEDAVRVMGADRVVFGSDFPIISQAYMLGCVLDADISEADKARILHGNAHDLLTDLQARRSDQ